VLTCYKTIAVAAVGVTVKAGNDWRRRRAASSCNTSQLLYFLVITSIYSTINAIINLMLTETGRLKTREWKTLHQTAETCNVSAMK